MNTFLWQVFQRRQDGSVDFYLDFANYSQGFGNLEGEFWLGNDNLHRLTAQGDYELRIDLSDFEDESRYAVYDSFSIADVSDNYRLAVGSYSGTAGNKSILIPKMYWDKELMLPFWLFFVFKNLSPEFHRENEFKAVTMILISSMVHIVFKFTVFEKSTCLMLIYCA